MKKLCRGIEQFQRSVYPQYRNMFLALADKQHPEAMLITCADSRIVPTLFLQCEPGDLFICRNAGNIVPPYEGGTGGVTATVEYAVDVLGIRHVIVCGHSDCGAMKTVLNPKALRNKPAIGRWLHHADRARRIAVESPRPATPEQRLRLVTEENVIAQLHNLGTHPAVAAGLARGDVDLYGWYYDITTASISSYDPAAGTFVPFDGTLPAATPMVAARRGATAR